MPFYSRKKYIRIDNIGVVKSMIAHMQKINFLPKFYAVKQPVIDNCQNTNYYF